MYINPFVKSYVATGSAEIPIFQSFELDDHKEAFSNRSVIKLKICVMNLMKGSRFLMINTNTKPVVQL